MMKNGFPTFYVGDKFSENYVTDKELSIGSYKAYMFNRLVKMFKYNNLPDTIPQEILEWYLMSNGSCYITKVKGELYAFMGSFGGEPDPYYRPTLYIIANPALKFNKELSLYNIDGTRGDDGVFMRNDVLWMGLDPLMSRFATLLAENTITMRTADIMLRVVALLTAPDDKTRAAGEKYLRDIEKGKIGVIGENRFFDGIKMQTPPSNNGSFLTQFIELHQFLTGSFFNEIGLSSLINMKREAISTGEASLNEDSLMPLVETMLDCRKQDVSQLNELYDTDISVDFDSVWLENIKEREFALNNLKGGVNNGNVNGVYGGNVEDSERDGRNIDSETGDSNISDGENGTETIQEGNIELSNGANNGDTADTGENDVSESNITDTGESDNAGDTNPNDVTINININLPEGGENDVSAEHISDSESDTNEDESDSEQDDTSDEGTVSENEDKS